MIISETSVVVSNRSCRKASGHVCSRYVFTVRHVEHILFRNFNFSVVFNMLLPFCKDSYGECVISYIAAPFIAHIDRPSFSATLGCSWPQVMLLNGIHEFLATGHHLYYTFFLHLVADVNLQTEQISVNDSATQTDPSFGLSCNKEQILWTIALYPPKMERHTKWCGRKS